MATKAFAAPGSTPAVTSSSFYRPELDALRLFAFSAVFFHHLGSKRYFVIAHRWTLAMQQAGAFGVCLFFLLSAYLITELLWKEQEKTGTIHLPSFYVRRILRIWPLYFALLIFYVILGHFIPLFSVSRGRILALFFLAGNWYSSVYGWHDVALALVVMWSISVEEQFYLLVPSIARWGGKRAVWVVSIFFLVLAQVALFFLGKHHVPANPKIWTNSLVQFQFFAAGCILALVLKDRAPGWNLPTRLLAAAAGLALWLTAGGPLHVMALPVEPGRVGLNVGYTLVLVGTVLIFLAVWGMPAKWVPRWAIYLGKISFGLYLFHAFFFVILWRTRAAVYVDRLKHYCPVADFLIEAVLTVAAASLSYQFFEKPFLRLKSRFTFVRSRPV